MRTLLGIPLGVWTRAALVTLAGLFWTSWFWLQPMRRVPLWDASYRFFDRAFLEVFGLGGHWRWVAKSYLFVLVPIALLWLMGRPPRALGLGRMADKGWRIVGVCFVVALPALVWLGLQPGMHRYYSHMFATTGWQALLANALVIVVEHALIEGMILVLALPGGGFSHAPDPPRSGRLAFLGFGFPPGDRSFFGWLGVPREVWPALVGQALVFGTVHAGKELAELVTAFPGGLGLGLLTYRIRSVWPSVLLHLGTGAIILATIWLSR